MPLTEKNQLQIAYKKLLGKVHTNPSFSISNESITTKIQLNSSEIFAEAIEQNVNTQEVTFILVPLEKGKYNSSLYPGFGELGENILDYHVYQLAFEQETNIRGTTYNSSQKVSDLPRVQLISSIDPRFYKKNNSTSDEILISKLSAIDWILDPYSGIVFIQDLEGDEYPNSVSGFTWKLDAHVYTGKFVDEAISIAESSVGSDIIVQNIETNGDSLDLKTGIRFKDEPDSDPTPDYEAAMLYSEGELEFYTGIIADTNKVLHLTRNNVLEANKIKAFGPQSSIQYHNLSGEISGSDSFIWDSLTNTLTASNISASNIDVTNINSSHIAADTIEATTITITDGTFPAAGNDSQIQFNEGGKLGASDKLTFEQGSNIFSLKVDDHANGNSAKLFVNTNDNDSLDTSGLLLSNKVNSISKDFKIDNQYDNTTAIYKIDSDLPLYINSDTQNLLTAGTSKLDMSAGKVEIWPNSSHYVKIGVESGTFKTNLLDFKLGVQENNTDYALFRYNTPDQQYTGGELKLYLANETLESLSLNIFGLNIPNYLAVGERNMNGLASFYFNENNGGTYSTLNLANISNFSSEYANIKYERSNGQGKLSFAVESTTPQIEINKDGIKVFRNIDTTGDINVLGNIEIGAHENKSLRQYYDEYFEGRLTPVFGTESSSTFLANNGLYVKGSSLIEGTSHLEEMRTKKSVVSGPSFIHDGYLQIKQNLNDDNSSDSPRGLTLVDGSWDCAYRSWKIYLSNSTSESRNGKSLSFYFVDYVDYGGNPNCDNNGPPTSAPSTGLRGYINSDAWQLNLNFTGQHRNLSETMDLNKKEEYLGLIVVSDGTYASFNANNITINEALPKVSLASKRNQKSVFGVVSDAEDENVETREYALGNFVSVSDKPAEDTRLIINSLGEGGIWVTNVNGNLENGDYITSCEIPGYGMKQDDDLLHNYTVAKITCDCDFDLNSSIYICEEFEWQGAVYKKAFVGCTYHCG